MRRLVLILIAVWLWAQPASAAIVKVQEKRNNNASSVASLALVWGSNTTSGNLITVLVDSNDSDNVTTVTDSQSNTYTCAAALKNSGTTSAGICYAENITGGVTPTVTVNFGGGNGTCVCQVRTVEWSGIATSSALDVSANTATATTVTTHTHGSITPAADALVIAVLSIDDQVFTTTGTFPSAGYTELVGDGGRLAGSVMQYQITTGSLGATNPSVTTGTTETSAAVIASFKIAGAAGGGSSSVGTILLLGVGGAS